MTKKNLAVMMEWLRPAGIGLAIQSGLANAATAVTALLVYLLDWGRYADATIVTVMLLFFTFSAANHVATAVMNRNMKPVNLLRPVMALVLIGFLVPPMIKALSQ